MTFKNMKIAITDNDHLKSVCAVLESMGFSMSALSSGPYSFTGHNCVVIYTDKTYMEYCHQFAGYGCELVTLSDLLKMRDEMELLK